MARVLLNDSWLPKSVLCLRDYSRHKFLLDLIAGVTVGLVALPLAMAFSIASGLTPQAGIYCAIVTGFLISALGGSKTQIGGPTGAFVVVVAGIVAVHGIDGLFMCTMMAGVLLVVMGADRPGLGGKVHSSPGRDRFHQRHRGPDRQHASQGFLRIASGQSPGRVLAAHRGAGGELPHAVLHATLLAACTLLIADCLPQCFRPRIPGPIVALVLAPRRSTFSNCRWKPSARGSAEFPAACRIWRFPKFRADLIHGLLGPAFTVAMLGAIESLMSAVVSDRMSGDRHNPNVELMAQGIANIVSPMFGGLARYRRDCAHGDQYPVGRADSGGRNDSCAHAAVHSAIAAPLVSYVPLAVLAGILMVVAYNMGEWREIPQLLKLTKTDISVWLVTFALTVFADLTVAVEAGMILAALLFISRVAATTTVSQVTEDYVEDGRVHILQDKDIPYYATIFRIHGPFLFGATDKISAVTQNLHTLPPVVILRLRNMTAIDATGLFAIEEVAKQLHAGKRTLILCGAREQPAQLIHQAEFAEVIGKENICENVQAALRRAEEVHEGLEAKAGIAN